MFSFLCVLNVSLRELSFLFIHRLSLSEVFQSGLTHVTCDSLYSISKPKCPSFQEFSKHLMINKEQLECLELIHFQDLCLSFART